MCAYITSHQHARAARDYREEASQSPPPSPPAASTRSTVHSKPASKSCLAKELAGRTNSKRQCRFSQPQEPTRQSQAGKAGPAAAAEAQQSSALTCSFLGVPTADRLSSAKSSPSALPVPVQLPANALPPAPAAAPAPAAVQRAAAPAARASYTPIGGGAPVTCLQHTPILRRAWSAVPVRHTPPAQAAPIVGAPYRRLATAPSRPSCCRARGR
jgi:hypothetical protein